MTSPDPFGNQQIARLPQPEKPAGWQLEAGLVFCPLSLTLNS
jgi:hypothetical protein